MKQHRTGKISVSVLAASVMACVTQPPAWTQTITAVVSGTLVDATIIAGSVRRP